MSEEKQALIHIGERYDAVTIEGQDLRGHSFIQCTFNHVKIAPTQSMYGATFYGCDASFIEAPGVLFDHFSARDCSFQHGNFKGATFHQSRLHKCDFAWSDFTDADLRLCYCEGSNFSISRVQKAKRLNPYDRDMVSELIRIEAGGDVEVLQVAALVKNSMALCWDEWELYSEMPRWCRVGDIIKGILHKYQNTLRVNSDIVNHVNQGE